MPFPASFLPVLTLLHQRLHDLPHPWVFTGSVGMVLQGMDLTPHDIDLQSNEAGAYALERRLVEFVTRPVHLRESERIRSYFGELTIGGIDVEIMGDMVTRLEDGRWGTPGNFAEGDFTRHIRQVSFEGMTFPVLDLAYEEAAYVRMGRLTRVELIHNFRMSQGGSDATTG